VTSRLSLRWPYDLRTVTCEQPVNDSLCRPSASITIVSYFCYLLYIPVNTNDQWVNLNWTIIVMFDNPYQLIPLKFRFTSNGESYRFATDHTACIIYYYTTLRIAPNAFRDHNAREVHICWAHLRFDFVGQEEHVTNSQDVYRIFPLKKSVVSTSELSFSVRAVISASVTYYTAPTRLTPCLVVSHDLL